MNEAALIDRATVALAQLGLEVLPLKQPRGARLEADAWLRLAKGKERIDYVAEAKRTVTPATVGAVLVQLRHLAAAVGRPALLITDYLTPPIAETLRAQQQQFVDAAGNAYLEGPGLLVYVTGRKLPDKQTRLQAGRAYTVNGLKILFALICDQGLARAPHRIIATAAGVALGAVPAVLADLQRAGHVLVAAKQRRFNATKRLLDEWALAYAHKLRPKTLIAEYATPHFAQWREWKLDPKQALWGGEPAAHLLVRYLKPGVLTIYTEKLPPRLMAEQRMVRAAHPAMPPYVEVRKPFWPEGLKLEGRPDTVPPALVYADLLATGDGRCLETAQMVYDEYLARSLPAA